MSLLQDLRFAVRLLAKNRWFTVMAAVVLALGIGANNAVFTIVNAVLLRNLPFPNPDQIMFVQTQDARGRTLGVSMRDFEDWRASARTFSHLTFIFSGSFNVGDEGRIPENYAGSYVSADFFRMLGISPARGRDFSPEEDKFGSQPVVLISGNVSQQRYGSNPAAIGRTIRLNGTNATIIGVMPEGMHFPNEADVWMPTGALPAAITDQPRQARGYFSIGRLADGVTLEQARTELKTIGAKLAADYPTTNKELAPSADRFSDRVVGPQLRTLFWVLMGAVGFVLLIACSNVANLLLARAAHRSGEVSVRVAMGASRWHIVRQLLIESILLALVAGGIGLLLSIAGIRWFDNETQDGLAHVRVLPGRLPRDGNHLRPCSRAPRVEGQRLRDVERGWPVRVGRHESPALVRRAHRRAACADAGTAGGRRLHDAQLLDHVHHGHRHQHVADAEPEHDHLCAQVPEPR